MAGGWDGAEELLVGMATDDLEATGEVQPALAAFRGDELRLLAFLRPFAKGAYAGPLTELLALAIPLGSDRLALSISGRAWSLDDPIPPVSADGDLRQRVLIVALVDAAVEPSRHASVVRPFDVVGADVRWGERCVQGAAEGWISRALAIAVRPGTRRALRSGDADIARQARRVVALGHELHLPPDVAGRLHRARPTA